MQLSPAFLKVEAKIRSLGNEFSRIQRDQELIPQLYYESSKIRADVESRLADLNPNWDLEFLSNFQSSLEQREKLEELASRFLQLETQRTKTSARQPDLKKRVDVASERLTELSSVQHTPELIAILEREPNYRAAVAALADASEIQASITSQLNSLKKRLSPILSAPDLTDEELNALPVPLESLLRDFQIRLATTADAVASAISNQQHLSQTLKERNSELSARAAEERVPDRSQLENQRKHRDTGWGLIRQKFLGNSEAAANNENVDQEIVNRAGDKVEALPETYEAEVAESDRLADDRQASSKEVSIRDRLITEISQLEGSFAQLGSAVDRLAPLSLAQALLKRAIERFEKEHQPSMLSEVGILLAQMTGGRYVSIRRRLDEAGTMLVEQINGKLKTPSQLSTGTREQLYLAIRLAYVQQYCRESEPLPLIMDDILVNFDEQRAKNTLDVLLALPDHIQVLFLTCHEHMAKLVRKSRPDLSPIELSAV